MTSPVRRRMNDLETRASCSERAVPTLRSFALALGSRDLRITLSKTGMERVSKCDGSKRDRTFLEDRVGVQREIGRAHV